MLADLNRLRTFYFVHREGSATEAAARLHVSQSAVSQSLAKLEEEVGSQLFVRRHRRLVPTPAADRLQQIVAPFFERLSGGLQDIHLQQHELVGTLRVGAPVEFGAHRLVPAFAEFRREHPQVQLQLTLGHPDALVPAVQDGRLDLAFTDVFDQDRWAGLDVTTVTEESLVVVGTRRYVRRTLGDARTFAALREADFIAYDPRAPGLRGWFRHHFGKAPAHLHLSLTVESVQAVVAAVLADLGLGLVPSHVVDDALVRGRLLALDTPKRALPHRISMARLADKRPTRLERRFAKWAAQRTW